MFLVSAEAKVFRHKYVVTPICPQKTGIKQLIPKYDKSFIFHNPRGAMNTKNPRGSFFAALFNNN